MKTHRGSKARAALWGELRECVSRLTEAEDRADSATQRFDLAHDVLTHRQLAVFTAASRFDAECCRDCLSIQTLGKAGTSLYLAAVEHGSHDAFATAGSVLGSLCALADPRARRFTTG